MCFEFYPPLKDVRAHISCSGWSTSVVETGKCMKLYDKIKSIIDEGQRYTFIFSERARATVSEIKTQVCSIEVL